MSSELEAFIEFITIIKALSKASIEAYTNDLSHIEEHYQASLLQLDEIKILKYLSKFENKRTLNRKLSSINAFYDFCHNEFESKDVKKRSFKFSKIPSVLPKYITFEKIMNDLDRIDRSAWI